MSKAKHTPGPWTLKAARCNIGCCDDLNDVLAQYPEDEKRGRHLAKVNGSNAVWLREGEAEANARLIAAAPDLLAALKDVAAHFKEDDDGNHVCWIGETSRLLVQAAIAKAEAQ